MTRKEHQESGSLCQDGLEQLVLLSDPWFLICRVGSKALSLQGYHGDHRTLLEVLCELRSTE